METKYNSIRLIADKIKRNPLLANVSIDAISDYAADFIRIVDTPASFIEKTAIIDIENYRGLLPCDYLEVIQVRTAKYDNCHHHIKPNIVYRGSTDSFHMSDHHAPFGDLTYKIQGDIIYTSNKEGKIEMSYRALAVDDMGIPLLPDSAKFERALEYYIKVKQLEIDFDQGKIKSDVLDRAEQEYCWAVGAYETECAKLSLDKARSLSSIWGRMISDVDSHRFGYINAGSREYLKVK